MIQFVIMGEPQGKGRPRFARSGHTYTPEKTAAYEKVANERRTGEKQPREADFAHLSQDRIEAIMGQKYGEELEIGFNCRFLNDGLKSCDEEDVKMEFSGQQSGMFMREDSGRDKLTIMILPVRLYG